MKFFYAAYSFAKHSIWHDDTPDECVFSAAKRAFEQLRCGCTQSRHFFRLAGQSGAGKTSQLFKSHELILSKSSLRPMHIAVRNFAKFHPRHDQLRARADYREKTNGFALKVAICVLDMALEGGYDIILEIALLDKRFERYIAKKLSRQSYSCYYHILCVNKLFSDIFIFKREVQTARTTFSSSSDYFYKIMRKSLKFLSKNANFDCFLWSIHNLQPIYRGKISACYTAFLAAQKKISPPPYSESELLNAKINFLEELYRDVHA